MRLHFWQTKAHAELFSQSIPMKVMPLVFMSISLRSNSSCPQTGQIRGMSPTRYRVVGVTIDLAAALRPAPILPSVFFMGVSFSSRTVLFTNALGLHQLTSALRVPLQTAARKCKLRPPPHKSVVRQSPSIDPLLFSQAIFKSTRPAVAPYPPSLRKGVTQEKLKAEIGKLK